MQKSYLIGANTIVPDYFCITPKNGATEVSWVATGSGDDVPLNLEYSYNKLSWTQYTRGTIITTSDPIYFRGVNPRFGYANRIQNKLVLNNLCDLSGRLSSIVTRYPKLSAKCTFINKVFSGNTYIRSIKDLELDLTITTYHIDDYSYMFNNCTSLIDTPKFISNISTVNESCRNMFEGCSSLTTIYELPNILSYGCYAWMFKNCTALTTVSHNLLPATTLANYCYEGMFSGCTSLTTTVILPATTLATGCYRFMFQYCSSLIELPALYATVLPDYCYDYMFTQKTSSFYFKIYNDTYSVDYSLPYSGTITQSYANSIHMFGYDGYNVDLNINTQYRICRSDNILITVIE